ncbi:hypothetical protein [Paenibacillus pini]|uniref:Uncharacterized protein n=1 Tax=Paenibacillus pini JCM 16418 TaxID=1236976 RepID=W7YJ23_9BACL|nr:hypothetical protein [Paenibacillus pini]GAF10905.1 hypothetical protein JCM16418_5139 [Paenibacillus pini JCM 16418]
MIESQKQNDIEWFKNKMESNDYSDCTPQEIHMIESGIEEIVKRVTLDAKLRLTKLISQIKDKTGEVITCTVEKNNNGGYDGEITGTKRTVHIQTIVAGGAVQQLHHRTLIK